MTVSVLILTNRPLVPELPKYLAGLPGDLVLLISRSAVSDDVVAAHRYAYREIAVVDDYRAPSVTDLAVELGAKYAATRVLAISERDLVRAAGIRHSLDLPGQDVPSASAFRDKFLMKSMVAQAGLSVPRMRLIRSGSDAGEVSEELGFPLVVKPVAGGGSVGVRKVHDAAALAEVIAGHAWTAGDLLAEQWIGGDLYAVNGIMVDGELAHGWPMRMGYPNYQAKVDSRPCMGWMLTPGDPLAARLRRFITEVVRALPAPLEPTALHAEVFHTVDDRLVLCEIASRPGGCGHVGVYERAFGVHLGAATLRGQAGMAVPIPPPLPTEVAGYAWFPSEDGVLRAVPQDCPVPGAFGYALEGVVGGRYRREHACGHAIAKLLVAAPQGEDLADRCREIEQWWEKETAWDRTC